ncbi:MAG: DUF6106 family protein [Bilifractor sp.]|jgi:hypothetical protein
MKFAKCNKASLLYDVDNRLVRGYNNFNNFETKYYIIMEVHVMDDLFTEVYVTRKRKFGSYLLQMLLILATFLLFLLAAFSLLSAQIVLLEVFFLAGVVMILVDRWLFKKFNVEYEYSYVNGSLDIAKIYSKETRKELASYDIKDAEVFAPAKSDHLADYRELPVKDYTAGMPEDREKAWAFVISNPKSRTREKVLIVENDKIIEDVRRRIPSKTFMM